MLNLMKMEIARIFKSKYSYFIFFATILTFFITVGLVNYTSKNIDNLDQTIVETKDDNSNGVKVDINKKQVEQLTDSGEDFVISSFSQSTYLIFLIIFASLFFSNPYANGFVKNFLGMKKNKGTYILATFIVCSLYIIVSFSIGAAILAISGPFINNGMLKFTDYNRLIKILFIELISHISYLSVILLASTITRSTAKTLMFTFLYPTVFFNFLRGIGDKFLSLFVKLPEDFSIANFVNIGNIISTNFTSANSDLMRSLVVAIVIGAISLILSCVIINKKDI
uniref:hypothetical protein n=1 Tax=Anaerococcus mediterraneensis TaxID=1870984 RepID=UPI000930343C|nr:hypothetical protein [Anaerococcus mediterraneensis]